MDIINNTGKLSHTQQRLKVKKFRIITLTVVTHDFFIMGEQFDTTVGYFRRYERLKFFRIIFTRSEREEEEKKKKKNKKTDKRESLLHERISSDS